MLGFLVLIFLYLFLLLARNTEKPARSSLARSLIVAGVFLFVLSLFSVVTVGVLFLLLLFIPFFFFPSSRPNSRFYSKQNEAFKDFFEQMRRQQEQEHQHHQYQRNQQGYQQPPRSAPKGMSVHQAATLLGVPIDATVIQIKSAYRKLMLKHHPDKGGTAEYAAKLNIARDVMMAYVNKTSS